MFPSRCSTPKCWRCSQRLPCQFKYSSKRRGVSKDPRHCSFEAGAGASNNVPWVSSTAHLMLPTWPYSAHVVQCVRDCSFQLVVEDEKRFASNRSAQCHFLAVLALDTAGSPSVILVLLLLTRAIKVKHVVWPRGFEFPRDIILETSEGEPGILPSWFRVPSAPRPPL
jgi:hypothetical protein